MTNSQIKISVIIPLFNKRSTIGRAIDSVLRQTRQAEEIIVVDDGSTDGSGDFVAEKYESVQVIKKSNGGVSSARNYGVSKASNDFIAFLDGDDWWSDRALEKFERLILRFPEADIYTFSHYRIDGKALIKKKTSISSDSLLHGFDFIALYSRYSGLIHSSSVCIKKRVLLDIGGFPEEHDSGEDIYVWLSIASKGQVAVSSDRFAFIERPIRQFPISKERGSIPAYIDYFCGPDTLEQFPISQRIVLLRFIGFRGLKHMMSLTAMGDRRGAFCVGMRIFRVNRFYAPIVFFVPLLPSWLLVMFYKAINNKRYFK
jgi:glycosyltransferase involved in cell wall biosynthesis